MKRYILIFLFSLASVLSAQSIDWIELNKTPGIAPLYKSIDGKIFGMSSLNIYQSSNDGLDWSILPLPKGQPMEFVCKGNRFLVNLYISDPKVINKDQTFLSTDEGETWARIFSSPSGYDHYMISDTGDIYAVAYNPNRGHAFVRFNGFNWDTLGNYLTNTPPNLWFTAIDSQNTFIIDAARSTLNLFTSTDYGTTWYPRFNWSSNTSFFIGSRNQIYLGLSQTNQFNKDGGVYLSTDRGVTWDLLGLRDQTIKRITTDARGNIYVLTTSGIFRYSILSLSWDWLGFQLNDLDAIQITNGGTLLASSITNYPDFESDPLGIIYRSTDNGEFWSPSAPTNSDIFSIIVSGNDNKNIIVGTLGDRIIKSTNGGMTWYGLPPGVIPDYVYCLSQNGSVIFAGTDEGLFRSNDASDIWENITERYFSGSVYCVDVNRDGTIAIGTTFGVYISSDNGEAWSALDNLDDNVFSIVWDKSGGIHVATDRYGILSTFDLGANWSRRGLVDEEIQTLAVDNLNHLFAGGYGGIYRCSNNDTSWYYSKFSNSYIYSIGIAEDGKIFAGTYRGVYMTSDRGDNWSQIGLNSYPALALTFDSNRVLYCGAYRGGVYKTKQLFTDVYLYANERMKTSPELMQNYPNPFNPLTIISYKLPVDSWVTLKVYDLLGREVAVLVNEVKKMGSYEVRFDGAQLPSGFYFYQLRAGDFMQSKKLVLLR
jgi:photosystem II stability/assembly factor-like uncharacterized protein